MVPVNVRPTRLIVLLAVLAGVAGLAWGPKLWARLGPSHELFIRVFKHEGVLEVWTRDGREPFRLWKSYPITARSGGPGPKRREGDLQVPEGFYRVNRFNPRSLFHLSLGLDYPNASDKILSDRVAPGSDIFIHGGAASVGCMPVGDEAVEEIYYAAKKVDAADRTIHVHIFPARMSGQVWEDFRAAETAKRPDLAPFWEDLRAGYEAFEQTHTVPEITVQPDGRYTVKR